MALYVSSARRLRRTILIASVAALVALVLGWAVGRQQVPSIDERVADVQERAADLATNLERLDIEYEQAIGSAGSEAAGTDTVEAGVVAPLDDLRVELQSVMDDAPWLGSPQRAALLDALAGVRSSAVDGEPAGSFADAAATAATLIRATFGISG